MIFKKSNTVLGLDIGTHAVKFVEMEHSNKGSVITNCGYARISEDNLEYDLSNALKHHLSKNKIRTKKVVIAVPACSTDDITLQLNFEENIPPNISNKELRDLIWLRTTTPDSDPYETIIDCQLLRTTTADGTPGAEFLLASVRREYIEERINIVKKIGLTPIAIDVDLFALERLAEYTGQLPSDSYSTIIDIGSSKASIGFYQNGILNFIFDINQGGKDITKEISDNLDMELNQAETHKLREVLFQRAGDEDVDEPYEADEDTSSLLETETSDSRGDDDSRGDEKESVSSLLYNDASYENLLPSDEDGADMAWQPNPEIANIFGEGRQGLYQSLNTCFRAYETDFSDALLSKIILAGGTSQMNNIADFFTTKFEVPTEIIHYADTIPIQEESENLETLKENEATYAVATGLALKLAPRVQSSVEPNVQEHSVFEETEGEEE